MLFRSIKKFFLVAGLSVIAFACNNSRVEKLSDGVIVHPQTVTDNGAKYIRIRVISDKIIHVQATATDTFSTVESIMAVGKERPPVNWNLTEVKDTVILSTNEVKVYVSLKTGSVQFCDSLNVPILTEAENGKHFTEVILDSINTYTVRQVFESDANEALFGLGQHQHGFLNLKGKDVDLTQFNSYVAIPFLLSNKNYGILWDNYSITKFGDPREYKPVSELKLYSVDGISGGLTAKYTSLTNPSVIYENRLESDINYEYLKLQKNFPTSFKLEGGMAVWEGFIESEESGLHKFLLNSAGYTKMWIDGKMVVDKWRQCWNPNKNQLSFEMKKGKRYPVKIEWKPDGGESFISLKTLKPYPVDEQNKISFSSEAGDQIDYYFIYGKNTDEVISGYRDITGKATMLPKWAMGLWQSRERYKTQAELLDVVKTFREKNIPFDNIVLDWQYWRIDNWGSHHFDSVRFPDPTGMICDLHTKYNSQIMISVWPKFYEGTDNYKVFNDKGWLYTQNIKNGQKDWLGYVSTFYDAFNPEARKLFWSQINTNLYKLGIDGWWLDATEPDILSNISVEDRKALMKPTYVKSPSKYFNTYAVKNAQGIYEGQRLESPDKRSFILTRSAYAGLQRYGAATWSGDIVSRWEDFKLQIPAGLNFCAAGMPYWTTDIGGFAVEKRYEKPSAADLDEWRELQTRWLQYGAFCPLFRVHGQFPYREMFNIAPENSIQYKSMLYYDRLRYHLMPYIYSLAGATYINDYTIMRPLVMDFGSDSLAYNCSDQFMFGPAFMVAPIVEYGARTRAVYLPKGEGWYNLYTGEFYTGGQFVNVAAPLEQIPLFVKEGSIIPLGPEIQYATQKSDEPVTLLVYTGKDCSFDLYEDDGLNTEYEKGAYSIMPVSYDEKSKTVTVGKLKGGFKGAENFRKFRIIWFDKTNPKKFELNLTSGEIIDYKGESVDISLK